MAWDVSAGYKETRKVGPISHQIGNIIKYGRILYLQNILRRKYNKAKKIKNNSGVFYKDTHVDSQQNLLICSAIKEKVDVGNIKYSDFFGSLQDMKSAVQVYMTIFRARAEKYCYR